MNPVEKLRTEYILGTLLIILHVQIMYNWGPI
jgi:hypothetical protein